MKDVTITTIISPISGITCKGIIYDSLKNNPIAGVAISILLINVM